jgi:glucuronoarabinoxylan endo-1,4-beta-xylanase
MVKQAENNSVNKHFRYCLVFFSFIQTMLLSQVYGQIISINGKLTSSRFPIQSATVTFIDIADTTRKFSSLTDASGNYQIGIVTSLDSDVNNPAKFELGHNYPNPFSSSTAIPYEIKNNSDVQVTIFDILGRVVRKFNVPQQAVGRHNILWDGYNNLGYKVADGIYFYRLNVNGESRVKKMILNAGTGSLPLSPSFSSNDHLLKTNLTLGITGNIYTARIENTDTTTPFVIPLEIPDIAIANDTTINFTVDHLPVATIDLDSMHQYIRGFGAANILPWRPDMTDSEIETAFGTGNGQLGFSILRFMIQPDVNQWNINVSTAQKAYERGVLIFASPWNAPSGMVEVVEGQTRVRYDMYDDYADHLDSYNSYMADNDVSLYAVSVQNEPDYANDWTGWTSNEMLTFMKENAHTIETRVMAPESFQFRRNMSDPILNDSVANANLDIVGGHIYGGGLASYPLAKEKGKEVWMTEHLSGENDTENNQTWYWSFEVAKEINNVMQAGMNAYVWWYIVRFYGPISDGTNNSGSKGDVTKKGYVMSQFSRFIRPGFYRVESPVSPPVSPVKVTAYKDPSTSKMIVVVLNTGSTEIENVFRIKNGMGSTTLSTYTTSETKNCEQEDNVIMTNGNFVLTLEPSSITTLVSE